MNAFSNLKMSLREFNARRKEKRAQKKEPKLWAERGYAPPSPAFIKRKVVLRNGIPGATWVETGTYKGDTTALLSLNSKKVFTIEPAEHLFAAAENRFASQSNVEVIKGLSEEIFPTLIPKLSGEVNFWLDGHFSAGITHQGPKDTPIEEELACIEQYLGNFSRLAVLVDDVRCFNPTLPNCAGYPKLDVLVDWARKNGFEWHIEHDIFVATSSCS